MKNARKTSLSFYLLLLTVAVMINLGPGCSEDKPTEPGGGSSSMSIDEIILNPKSPSLGDTMRATAVVTGTSTPGDYAQFQWTVTSGELLDNNQQVVRWVAPTTPELVSISVTASNSASSASWTSNIFVNDIQPFLPNRGGEMHLSPTGDSLISIYSPDPPDAGSFTGWGIRINDASSEKIVIGVGIAAKNIKFSRELDRAAYQTSGSRNLVRMNYINMSNSAKVTLPNTPYNQRGPQYTEADFLPGNSDLMAYQVWWPDQDKIPSIGGVDSFQVVVYDISTGKEKRVVTLGRNYHPSFSTDGRWLTFVSDRSGRFEYHAVRVNGTTVNTDSISGDRKLTSSGGQMGPGLLPKVWSPTAGILATLDKSGTLWIIEPETRNSIEVPTAGAVREFAFAPSGDFLIFSAAHIIYRIDDSGLQVLYEASLGDKITRFAVSADENFLLYLNTRLTENWYELLDLSGVTGLTAPLRITAASTIGKGTVYAAEFSLNPVWLPNEAKAHLLFFDGGVQTPKIATMDFNGLLPTP